MSIEEARAERIVRLLTQRWALLAFLGVYVLVVVGLVIWGRI